MIQNEFVNIFYNLRGFGVRDFFYWINYKVKCGIDNALIVK